MAHYICRTCGTQFGAAERPPELCPICEDERQYIGWLGQQWTTLEDLRRTHSNVIRAEDPGVHGIGTKPDFAIAQRALLVQSPAGNVLWDCISLLDEATIAAVRELGGIAAIAISHPHYYSSMVEWSQAFGGVPIYLHSADREHVMRPGPAIVFWDGDTRVIGDGFTLIRCGGHFEGATVLHWGPGAALFTGDVIKVSMDRRMVSFMYSYPNLIPLDERTVDDIARRVERFTFDRIYGGWWGEIVEQDGKRAVRRSAERYIAAISE